MSLQDVFDEMFGEDGYVKIGVTPNPFPDHEFGNGGFVDAYLTEHIDVVGIMRTSVHISVVCNAWCNAYSKNGA